MKAEPMWPIPRKLTENLQLLIAVQFKLRHGTLSDERTCLRNKLRAFTRLRFTDVCDDSLNKQ